ncbi:SGNH/GDSL hydrolase family protein [Actinoplanes sp. NPDC051494]|uniref:SGNH/GDSL hydrolase family protein n=1 Tax=Actinoplanes sp. NPDC051494 TaxID=3363907 RepID=UPI003796AF7B
MRLAVLGASSAAGLGVRGRSYAVLVAERLDADLLQLARTTQTVNEIGPDALERIHTFGPTLVIVSFGAAEGFVHPSRVLQRILDRCAPRSWRGPAGLEPRPYYSRTPVRRWRQHAMSATKVLLKRLIIPVTGGFQRLPEPAYEKRLRALLADLPAGVPKLLVGLWPVDERSFPRSNRALRRNDEIMRAAADERADTVYVPAADAVRPWTDYLADHAHLNDQGHDRVADLILSTIDRTPHDPRRPHPTGSGGHA